MNSLYVLSSKMKPEVLTRLLSHPADSILPRVGSHHLDACQAQPIQESHRSHHRSLRRQDLLVVEQGLLDLHLNLVFYYSVHSTLNFCQDSSYFPARASAYI